MEKNEETKTEKQAQKDARKAEKMAKKQEEKDAKKRTHPGEGQDHLLPFATLKKLKKENETLSELPMASQPVFNDEHALYQYGLYLKGLTTELFVLLPVLGELGDQLHSQNRIKKAQKRMKLQESVKLLGQSLESVALSTGSVCHLYQNLEMGEAPDNVKVNLVKPMDVFQSIFALANFKEQKKAQKLANAPNKVAPEEESKTEAKQKEYIHPGKGQDHLLPFATLKKLMKDNEFLSASQPDRKMGSSLVFDDDQMLYQYAIFLKGLQSELFELLPKMSELGDLLHHQQRIRKPTKRMKVQEAVRLVGKSLESLALSTGSVCHLYQNLVMGEAPADLKVNLVKPRDVFLMLFSKTNDREKLVAQKMAGSVAEQPEEVAKPESVAKPEKQKKSKPLLTLMAAMFNAEELAKFMQGNFAEIEKFGPRIRKVMIKFIGDLSPKDFRKKALKAIHHSIKTPEDLKSKLNPDFDPRKALIDILSDKLLAFVKLIHDHKGTDAELINFMEVQSQALILLILDDLRGGFQGDAPDLLAWLAFNVKAGVESACDPSQAAMASNLTPSIMKYIEEVISPKI